MWTGGGGPAPCGRPHRKLKLESTDVIPSSSHAKKLVYIKFLIDSVVHLIKMKNCVVRLSIKGTNIYNLK